MLFAYYSNISPLIWELFGGILFIFIILSVDARRATSPIEDVEDIVKRLNNFNINDNENNNNNNNDNQGPPCLLDVQKDFPRPNDLQPLYLMPDTNQFWLPNEWGQLEIPHGAVIELQCTESFANFTEAKDKNNRHHSSSTTTTHSPSSYGNIFRIAKNTRTIRPRCLQDKSFMWQGEKYEFRQFMCARANRYFIEQLHEKCPAMTDDQSSVTAEMYRVGFNISSNRFVENMRICYEPSQLRTLYVRYVLTPASIHFQRAVKRLNFNQAGYFKGFNMNHIYSRNNQQQQAAATIQDQHVQHLIDNRQFLTRGHMAAKADFIYASQQRSTFNFFNAAPQWQGFNGGQWQSVEDAVRKYAADRKQMLHCYTGTWGIMKLPLPFTSNTSDAHINTFTTESPLIPQRDFYLTRDDNNNGLLPVPMLYYRLVVNSQHSHGIVLVGVNNPHASLNEIISEYVICDDIHEEVGWLRWMQNKNLQKGYLYACHVGDFVRAVGHLPSYLLNVTEILS
ncbi:salivary protein Tsal1 [Musca autumnalis]|uniref:salivary protein Tsal1 n=1 Tax=Musca autumnalis TaxID=221902 RepID=UPI003CE849A8